MRYTRLIAAGLILAGCLALSSPADANWQVHYTGDAAAMFGSSGRGNFATKSECEAARNSRPYTESMNSYCSGFDRAPAASSSHKGSTSGSSSSGTTTDTGETKLQQFDVGHEQLLNEQRNFSSGSSAPKPASPPVELQLNEQRNFSSGSPAPKPAPQPGKNARISPSSIKPLVNNLKNQSQGSSLNSPKQCATYDFVEGNFARGNVCTNPPPNVGSPHKGENTFTPAQQKYLDSNVDYQRYKREETTGRASLSQAIKLQEKIRTQLATAQAAHDQKQIGELQVELVNARQAEYNAKQVMAAAQTNAKPIEDYARTIRGAPRIVEDNQPPNSNNQ
jgi:hypothetical protein